MQQQQFYQIFENNHPLFNEIYPTNKLARDRLKHLSTELTSSTHNHWYQTIRQLSHLPLGSTLWLQRTYSDGFSIRITYRIVNVKYTPSYIQNS